MARDILGRENRTIKRKAQNIISNPDFYTREEIKQVYESVTKDNRLAQETKVELMNGLRKVYKRK